MSPLEVAQHFVEQINAHDLDAVVASLTREHRFIDSLGAEFRGRETLREGWRQYFRMVPDYRIEVARTIGEGPEVILLGTATGTYTSDGKLAPTNAWSTPAAWRAVIRDGLVDEWQVYADNEPIRRCMARKEAT